MLKRQMFCFFGLVFFAIGAIILGIFVFPSVHLFCHNEKDYKAKCAQIVHKLWKILVKYLEITNVLKVEYQNEISTIKNKIIVASHPSYVDILILIALVPNSLSIVKKSILNNFIMQNVVKSLYITNDNSVEDFLSQSQAALSEGFNIIIFPTGQRTDKNDDIHIHKGAAKLAILTNTPIVPIKITTSDEFMPKNQSILNIGKHKVVFELKMQEEINVSDFSDENEIALRNKICAIIKEKI